MDNTDSGQPTHEEILQEALRLYDKIFSRIKFDTRYDSKAEWILGALDYFQSERFTSLTDALAPIIEELKDLMPTPDQIAASRNITKKRGQPLRSRVIQPDQL